ncbi:hypothetical protein SHIRM173S_02391 [Streptomyces hirsutus]
MRRPMRRAGIANSRTRASRVIRQDRVSITARASTSVTTLPTTVDRVLLKARSGADHVVVETGDERAPYGCV